MNSDIDRFYTPDGPFIKHGTNFWQHGCGIFQWHLSEHNVNLCCPTAEFNKITWPNVARYKSSKG